MRDYTQGDLRRAIILLAIPMILEMVMESLFGVVDMFFVAPLGVDSLATVALTESILVLVFGISLGSGYGDYGLRLQAQSERRTRKVQPWPRY